MKENLESHAFRVGFPIGIGSNDPGHALGWGTKHVGVVDLDFNHLNIDLKESHVRSTAR